MADSISPAPHVVILGAGLCGLYAARTLRAKGIAVTLVEKETWPGGLAMGQCHNGNWYDLGVHMLHEHDKGVFEDMKSIMGDERIAVDSGRCGPDEFAYLGEIALAGTPGRLRRQQLCRDIAADDGRGGNQHPACEATQDSLPVPVLTDLPKNPALRRRIFIPGRARAAFAAPERRA